MLFFSNNRVLPSSLSSSTTKATPVYPQKAKILEISLISAQHLSKNNKPTTAAKPNMQTYVVVYVDPNQKLVSRTDTTGGANPTWNDRFVFMIEEEFLSARPTSCMVFEVHQKRRKMLFFRRKDKKICEGRVLLAALMDEKVKDKGITGGFFAFNVRRTSGEARGVIDIGAARLDDVVFREDVPGFFGSMSAVDYRKLAGGGDGDQRRC